MKKIIKNSLMALLGLFMVASCADVPEPYPIPNQPTEEEQKEIAPLGTGTADDPFNVAAAIKKAKELGADVVSSEAYYIKGKVLANTTTETTINSYGNMTFTMVDEGNTENTFTAFQVYGPGNKKFTSVDQIKKDDEVVIYGKIVNYQGNTPETVGKGSAYVVSINENSEGGGDQPGIEAIEVTCAQAVELTSALENGATSAETYTITGYITEVIGNVSRSQQSFWMADTKDGGKVFEAYWANLPEGVEAFTVGSKVSITGNLMKYMKNDEMIAEMKNANVIILEAGEGGSEEGGGSGDQPGAEAKAVTCAEAAAIALALEDKASTTEDYVVTGYITETDGKVSRNQQVFWMADTKDGGKVFEAYWANLNEPYEALPVGTKLKMTGKLMRYGTTAEMKNGDIEVLEMGEGGEQGGDQGEGGGTSTSSDAMTIANLPSDITVNAYGSQAAATESTWLTWTWNNIEFAGARVCKANAIDGCIQIQGNASDNTKQGFIFNKTAWPNNISKVTLVIKVKDSATAYDPSYSLYAGSTAHPTTGAIEPTPADYTLSNDIRTYTQVFDLSKANAKYFSIVNDKAGVLYIEKIVVE